MSNTPTFLFCAMNYELMTYILIINTIHFAKLVQRWVKVFRLNLK